MSVAQAHGIVRVKLRNEKREAILKQLPEHVQHVWEEYAGLGLPHYNLNKVERFILYFGAMYIKVKLKLKDKQVKTKMIYNDILADIQAKNKKIQEFAQKPEVQLVLKSFEKYDVAWNDGY